MKTNSWKLSALVSALILTGINVYADEEYEAEVRESLINVYSDDEKKEDREDREDEEDEDKEDKEDGEDEEDTEDEEDGENSTTEIVLPTSYAPDAGRLLGSQCAQCHGTNGISSNEWDSIAGEGNLEDEIYEDDEPIMSAQAHGYTSEEIILIGNWLKILKNND